MRFRIFAGLGRRVFFLALALVVLSVAVGTALSFYSASLISPTGGADLVSFQVAENPSASKLTGVGISLDSIPGANLLVDPSFEPYGFRTALRVYSGDASSVTVSSEEAGAGLYGEGFFDGATVRILSTTQDGMVLRKSGHVTHFSVNRIGPFARAQLPQDLPKSVLVSSFGVYGDLVGATAQKGIFLLGIGTQSPTMVETGLTGDLTDVCGTSDGFLVVSSTGEAATSADGMTWTPVPVDLPVALRAVASSGGVHVAVGDGGALRIGVQGAFYTLSSGTTSNLKDVASDSGRFVAVGAKGTVLASEDGYAWRTVDVGVKTGLNAVASKDGRFVAAGYNGVVVLSSDLTTFGRTSIPGEPDIVDVVMLDNREVVALDSKGGFYNSLDGGYTWVASSIDTGMDCRIFDTDGKDLVLSAGAAGVVGTTRLVSQIQIDSPLLEGTFTTGDICYLDLESATPPASYLGASTTSISATGASWTLHGNGTAARIAGDAAPGCGDGFLRLSYDASVGAKTNTSGVYLTQKVIPEGGYSRLPKQVLCRVELWMRQEGTGSKSATVWLTGPFDPIGQKFDRIGNKWKKYSFTFLAPVTATGVTTGEVRINIGFEGSGQLDIDGLYLGTASSDATLADSTFLATLSSVKPTLLRLGGLGIGSAGVLPDRWAGLPDTGSLLLDGATSVSRSDTSLEAGLRLAQKSGADPWLVIGSYASEAEVRNLLEYIAGPISEVYGQKRMDNGTTPPWSGSFDRIVLEFSDDDKVFGSDGERALYVNTMIAAVEQSPYYKYLKSKIIFVDGMVYDAGVMLSRADLHASDFAGGLTAERSASLEALLDKFYEASPRVPDRPASVPLETMRSVLLSNAGAFPQAADYAEVTLRDLGGLTNGALVTLPDFSARNPETLESRIAAILSKYAAGTSLTVTETLVPLPSSGAVQTTASQSDLGSLVGAYGFRNGNAVSVVLDNRATKPVFLDIDLPFSLQDGRVLRYDVDGRLVDSVAARGTHVRVSTLPGWVYVLEGTTSN